MIKAVNIEEDEKAVEAAKFIAQYCSKHEKCKYCIFHFSHVCALMWVDTKHWDEAVTKIYERRSKYIDK